MSDKGTQESLIFLDNSFFLHYVKGLIEILVWEPLIVVTHISLELLIDDHCGSMIALHLSIAKESLNV